jgi:hypothetical protein
MNCGKRRRERTMVTARVSGTFPGGPVRYQFMITGEKIARLEIP